MSNLTFTLKTEPDFKLNCGALTPNNLAGLSSEKIAKLKLGTSKNSPQVADFFDISFEKVNQNIKAGSSTNHIIFKNSPKCNMAQLDFIGANMAQGKITVCGNAGDRLGDKMRRGLILVEGNVGDYAASRMLAGTLGILGKCGAYTGFAMKRGTILLKETPQLHATIQDCGVHTLPFLSLLFKSLENPQFSAIASNRVQRFAGDLSVNGNGEILVLQA